MTHPTKGRFPDILIRGGRLIDPADGRDTVSDLRIVDGRVQAIGEGATACAAAGIDVEVIEAAGLIVCPGLMDIHVHLREPGFEHKETIESGTWAAANGGFTHVACMPNTKPALDNPETVRLVLERAGAADFCRVGPTATITRGRSGGELTDFAALRAAGAVAFTDDGDGVEDDAVMRSAFERAADTGSVLIQHCEYRELSAGGVMHLGEVSRRVGLPGLDPRSEEAMIERDIALCRETGGRYHVAHISTARAVELVRHAKAEGLPVTTEVCTHHLVLDHSACGEKDPNTKMHPPLRTIADVAACRAGLVDGTIDCIVTDHAPHAADEKAKGFLQAPPGIVGLETALPLAIKAMVDTGLADFPDVIRWFTTGPAAVLGLPPGGIREGETADLCLIDPASHWTVEAARFASRSRNTPFDGWDLRGRAVGTIRGHRVHRSSML